MQLYIHVPFCRSRCVYCGFYSNALTGRFESDEAQVRRYVTVLLREMELWAGRVQDRMLESVFLGGGTPSLLPPNQLKRIFKQIHCCFTLRKGVEITLEGNPESLLEPGYMYELATLGVNRLSIGAQSMNEERLRVLGRSHSLRQVEYAVSEARKAGFTNLSLDLIWGHPGQKARDWLNELRLTLQLKPEHLSCYGLSLDEGTPLARAVAKGLVSLPPENEQEAMYTQGSELLNDAGYLHYEISNYARLGYQCRHNVGYWEGREYLGLGPAASGTLGPGFLLKIDNGGDLPCEEKAHSLEVNKLAACDGGSASREQSGNTIGAHALHTSRRMLPSAARARWLRWTNPADLALWESGVTQGRLPAQQETLTPLNRVQELIMLRLRMARGLSLHEYRSLTGHSFMEDHGQLAQALHEKGLVKIRGGFIRLSEAGMLVSNSILQYLFAEVERLYG